MMINIYNKFSIFLIICLVLNLASGSQLKLQPFISEGFRVMNKNNSKIDLQTNSELLLPIWAATVVRDTVVGNMGQAVLGNVVDGVSGALDSIGLGFVSDAFGFLGIGDSGPSNQDVMDHMDGKFDELNNEIATGFATVNGKLENVEYKIAKGFHDMNGRFDKQFEHMNGRFDKQFEHTNGRFDKIDKQMFGIWRDVVAMQDSMNHQFKKIGSQIHASTDQLLSALRSVATKISEDFAIVNNGLDSLTVQLDQVASDVISTICAEPLSNIDSLFRGYRSHMDKIVQAIVHGNMHDYREEVVRYNFNLNWGETDLNQAIDWALDCHNGRAETGRNGFFHWYAKVVRSMEIDPAEKIQFLAAALIHFFQVYEKADILLFHIVYKNHLKALTTTTDPVIKKWSAAKKQGKSYVAGMERVIEAKADQRRIQLADQFWEAVHFVLEGLSCTGDYLFHFPPKGSPQSRFQWDFRDKCKTSRYFPWCPMICPNYKTDQSCAALRRAMRVYEGLKRNWPYSWTTGAADTRVQDGYVFNNVRFTPKCRVNIGPIDCKERRDAIPIGVWYTEDRGGGVCIPFNDGRDRNPPLQSNVRPKIVIRKKPNVVIRP